MSAQIYYILHTTGIVLVFLSYGMLIARGRLQSEDPGEAWSDRE